MLYSILVEGHLGEEKAIMIDNEREYSYLQLHQQAMAMLAYMRQQGICSGDRVMIENHNDGRTVTAILSCIAGGMIFVLVPEGCQEAERQYIMQDCSAAMFLDLQNITNFKQTDANITQKSNLESAKGPGATNAKEPSSENAKDSYMENGGKSEWDDSGDVRDIVPESAGVYILYTSGTEGIRKGVLACQHQVIFCCNGIHSRLNYKETDKVLCSLPLEFDYGLYQVFLSLQSNTTLFLAGTAVIQMIPRQLLDWQITIFPTIPSVVNLLLKLGYLNSEELPFLRKITFTGEYLPVSLIKSLKKALPETEVIPMYGVTECKRIAVMPEGREDKTMAGSCGLPLDGITVSLEGMDADGIGELVVEGPNVMEGYWNNTKSPANTVNSGKTITNRFVINANTGQKAYRTGDLLSIDEEGFLYFRGRCNGLIKSRGYRISELEVERIVQEIEGVVECAVVGIPDEICGERIGVCVYAQSREVLDSIVRVISQYTIYRNNYTIFAAQGLLPRNSNQKIDKIKLKRMIYDKDRYFFWE